MQQNYVFSKDTHFISIFSGGKIVLYLFSKLLKLQFVLQSYGEMASMLIAYSQN